MAERTGVEQIVEKVVSQVLDSHVPQLREELVRRVLEELPQATGEAATGASGEGGSANLLKAISAIQSGTTQREILRTLLDNTVRYSGRGALFVVKAGAATGWQGRGFDKDGDDTIKDFALNVSTGVPEQALRSRMPFSGATRDIDPEFVAKFGAPADDHVLVLPLLLKEKVAALVYADAGADGGGKLDASAVELLVLATSAWLEVASLRKQAHKEEPTDAASREDGECAAAAARRPTPIRLRRTLQNTLLPIPSRFRLHLRSWSNRSRWRRLSLWSRRPRRHLLRQPMPLPISHPRTLTSIARRTASHGCWWMKSNCTTR